MTLAQHRWNRISKLLLPHVKQNQEEKLVSWKINGGFDLFSFIENLSIDDFFIREFNVHTVSIKIRYDVG